LDYLASHRRIHSGDKAYECDVCKKKFRRSGNLERHKGTHETNPMNAAMFARGDM
jgi:uncharacterized Zn-finger protein